VAKTWVLDTETKGTGAHVVPLKRAGGAPAPKLDTVTLRRPEQPARQPESDSTPTFKVVDVMSATVIAEGVDARGAVDALAGMRSVHDARVYARAQASGRWRLLTLAEQRSLWSMRAAASTATPAGVAG
jgi:hypothetical protein